MDIAAITSQVYDRLVSHSAGASVRAALRGGVVAADTLDPSTLPATPFIAFREGSISGKPHDTEDLTFRLYIYDTKGYRRINQILTLIRAAYPSEDNTAFVPYSIVSMVVGDARPDAGLGNLPCRPLTLQLRTCQ